MPPLRLGLIGAGRWGRAYLRTIQSLPDLALARLCSANPESRALVDSSCQITRDWREVAEASDLDGVIVCTPPALHAMMTGAAVRAGLPAMVEKPLTLDLEEALRLQETVERAGVPVLVDHIHLFHPAYQALKREAARLGPVRRIRAEGGSLGPFREDTTSLWDYGPHDLAMCLDLLGASPRRLAARLEETRETPEGRGENFALELDFPGGARAGIRVGKIFPEKRRRFAAWLGGCALVFDDLAPQRLVRHPLPQGWEGEPPALEGPGEPLPFDYEPPLAAALKAFARGIRGESLEGLGVELGVEIVRLLNEAERQLPPEGRIREA
ncbi:MAG: Gfo/Idh/MocA family oxidoreductase [Candidatus Tectomicrobia bacterium]|uniref:Gfo/Idh/MocA family oxidoreductase n=1 Tax=Tectimicrobiota bacterium TaxID=2528274 RepID=A0A932MN88_UNCTE|nr:Gfo/Idh/MocA family oxidoreductase [Candidatus Tectomicrobia bacterium]